MLAAGADRLQLPDQSTVRSRVRRSAPGFHITQEAVRAYANGPPAKRGTRHGLITDCVIAFADPDGGSRQQPARVRSAPIGHGLESREIPVDNLLEVEPQIQAEIAGGATNQQCVTGAKARGRFVVAVRDGHLDRKLRHLFLTSRGAFVFFVSFAFLSGTTISAGSFRWRPSRGSIRCQSWATRKMLRSGGQPVREA